MKAIRSAFRFTWNKEHLLAFIAAAEVILFSFTFLTRMVVWSVVPDSNSDWLLFFFPILISTVIVSVFLGMTDGISLTAPTIEISLISLGLFALSAYNTKKYSLVHLSLGKTALYSARVLGIIALIVALSYCVGVAFRPGLAHLEHQWEKANNTSLPFEDKGFFFIAALMCLLVAFVVITSPMHTLYLLAELACFPAAMFVLVWYSVDHYPQLNKLVAILAGITVLSLAVFYGFVALTHTHINEPANWAIAAIAPFICGSALGVLTSMIRAAVQKARAKRTARRTARRAHEIDDDDTSRAAHRTAHLSSHRVRPSAQAGPAQHQRAPKKK